MDTDRRFFIQLLSDHLAGKKSDPRQDTDWKQILSLAKNHQVEGILYHQCHHDEPQDICGMLQSSATATIFYYVNRLNKYKEIKKSADRENIPLLTVKGLEVARYYPQPSLRTMGDLDILVHKEDKEKVDRILKDLGMYTEKKDPDCDWVYFQNGLSYELHHKLFYDEIVTLPAQAAFFNDFWPYVKNGELDWSFHFLFLIAHLRKHIITRGAGIRQFMDIAVLIQNGPQLDWHWIESELRNLNMLKFAYVCFGLIDEWFSIRAPLPYPRLDPSFIDEAAKKILDNGVFGFDDDNNNTNALTNRIRRFGGATWGNRIRMFLEALFPKYEKMRYVSYYSFLNERPWLLPVGWVYRIYRMLTGRTVSWRVIMRKIMTTRNVINKREAELARWGL